MEVMPKQYQPQDLFEIVADTVISIKTKDGSGSGVIFNKNGIAVTNRHVVDTNTKALVGLRNGDKFIGKVIRSYSDIDLAFVKFDLTKSSLLRSSLIFSGEDFSPCCQRKLKVGEPVFAIGHPMGLDYTLTQGIISSIERTIEAAKFIQIDVSINPGNSGGALYTAYGELAGINTMGYVNSEHLNFAIPIDEVVKRYSTWLEEEAKGFTRYCAVCGFSSIDDKYCENCGASLKRDSSQEDDFLSKSDLAEDVKMSMKSDALATCKACGTSVSSSLKYCSTCGSTL
ncbi:Putative serine protease HhoA [Halomicronema hongdechloris C2206]|uniref:Serine protease HhoA n=1 Tax=Halomicronema hongdechloris C2206 TaxID=1641165 RepID=A0A1Z3HGP1_9CYAN|nr:trypsin-like peptidase domain-containing protein [Halomicronema hongdechloris]ASC69408.1 Putative serine protease HhoA [Halomicronema hongdechloris C2206]